MTITPWYKPIPWSKISKWTARYGGPAIVFGTICLTIHIPYLYAEGIQEWPGPHLTWTGFFAACIFLLFSLLAGAIGIIVEERARASRWMLILCWLAAAALCTFCLFQSYEAVRKLPSRSAVSGDVRLWSAAAWFSLALLMGLFLRATTISFNRPMVAGSLSAPAQSIALTCCILVCAGGSVTAYGYSVYPFIIRPNHVKLTVKKDHLERKTIGSKDVELAEGVIPTNNGTTESVTLLFETDERYWLRFADVDQATLQRAFSTKAFAGKSTVLAEAPPPASEPSSTSGPESRRWKLKIAGGPNGG